MGKVVASLHLRPSYVGWVYSRLGIFIPSLVVVVGDPALLGNLLRLGDVGLVQAPPQCVRSHGGIQIARIEPRSDCRKADSRDRQHRVVRTVSRNESGWR